MLLGYFVHLLYFIWAAQPILGLHRERTRFSRATIRETTIARECKEVYKLLWYSNDRQHDRYEAQSQQARCPSEDLLAFL
jgi:hypothetical protein